MNRTALVLLALSLAACSKIGDIVSPKPTAKQVADLLTSVGVVENCKQEVPARANARASEYFKCDLKELPGKGAGIMVHATDADYEATVKTYEGLAAIAGSHRYGNPSKRVFVQLNEGAPLSTGARTKAVLAEM